MKQDKSTMPYVFRLTLIATLGGLLFGYDTAVVSGAVKAIHEYFVVPLSHSFWIPKEAITGFAVSSALIGCIIGGSIAGFISLTFGRKKGLVFAALFFIFSGFGAPFPEKIISEQSTDIVIPSFGQTSVTINMRSPSKPGTFTVIASLERENEKPVRSVREIPFN